MVVKLNLCNEINVIQTHAYTGGKPACRALVRAKPLHEVVEDFGNSGL